MNLELNNIKIPIEDDGFPAYLCAAAEALKTDVHSINIIKILSKALDLRDLDQLFYKITLAVNVSDDYHNHQKFRKYQERPAPQKKQRQCNERPLIVGFGPAGMFAALELIDHGICPIIFERGKVIDERTVDVQKFLKEKKLNPESNIQFGEGGAGSYSDGKLFSRRNNNTGYIHRVLQTFIKFGAPEEIDYIHKPHLGTDVLCKIVRNIRKYILERGGEIHYNSQMTDLLVSKGRATGIRINDREEFHASAIFLAIGHSARDTYAMLHKKSLALEQKAISIGVRIEHPVETINLMRYGKKYQDYTSLGAATYSLNYTNKVIRRGVYTFCMCPGGEVLNASSENGMLVVNGMSYSTRSSSFSNAALAVSCHTSDYPSSSPLAGLDFQARIEEKAFKAGGGQWKVPAQGLLDFLNQKDSVTLPSHSFKMGAQPANLREILPDFVTNQLHNAFSLWKEEVPIFISNQAILMAVETRTSSPVRITRKDNHEAVNMKKVYPIGEGSGYTGGITSSAADAVRAVESYLASPQ